MTKLTFEAKIWRIAKSRAIIIPKALCKYFDLNIGDGIEVNIIKKRVVEGKNENTQNRSLRKEINIS